MSQELFEEERKYLRKNADILRRVHKDYILAVKGKVILGRDRDISNLSRKVHYAFPDLAPYLITTIDRAINPRAVELPSPEVVR